MSDADARKGCGWVGSELQRCEEGVSAAWVAGKAEGRGGNGGSEPVRASGSLRTSERRSGMRVARLRSLV